jgi:hypothetical protein
MRTLSLVAALVAGAVLAGCSKPEPAAGAPTPDVVTVDSSKTADSTVTAAVPDSMMKDSTMLHDSTMSGMKDSAATTVPDTAVPDSAAKP